MSRLVWRKSRRSNDQGGECVELARLHGMGAVRDSKDPEGSKLVMSREAFSTLAATLKK
jgi:hypothetical protein